MRWSLALALGVACSSASSPHARLCGELCRTFPPACAPTDCPARCESMLAAPLCQAESLTLYQCQSKATPADYQCQAGHANLNEAFCADEAKAWIHCTLNQ